MKNIKKSYIIISIFYLLLIFFLLLNSFILNILKGNTILLFVLIPFILFIIIFDLEKDRHRYTKDIIFEIIIFLLIFFLIYYMAGILIGFYKSDNYYSWYGIKKFILPTLIKCILIEIFRYSTLKKSEESKALIVLNFLTFLLIDLTETMPYVDTTSAYSIFLFTAMNLLPSITKNIVATYLSLNFGYKPFIVYSIVMSLYPYLLPIIPNYNKYLYSIIMLLLPVLLNIRIKLILNKIKDEEISRDYKKKKIINYIVPIIIVCAVVYLTSGYFRYYAIAIASGSMSGTIEKGDVVIINQSFANKENNLLTSGQVIAFYHDDKIFVHRIIRIVEGNDENVYYTKGDANAVEDGFPIKEEEILGIVKLKIPYIGLPAIWLNGL